MCVLFHTYTRVTEAATQYAVFERNWNLLHHHIKKTWWIFCSLEKHDGQFLYGTSRKDFHDWSREIWAERMAVLKVNQLRSHTCHLCDSTPSHIWVLLISCAFTMCELHRYQASASAAWLVVRSVFTHFNLLTPYYTPIGNGLKKQKACISC